MTFLGVLARCSPGAEYEDNPEDKKDEHGNASNKTQSENNNNPITGSGEAFIAERSESSSHHPVQERQDQGVQPGTEGGPS